MTHAPPLQFLFGLHLHQPVGNFDHVFQQHVDDVYLPFLNALVERDAFPIALHVSGPLVEWLRDHDRRYLDLVGRLVTDGKIELLLAGCYEPILAVLPRQDRIEQILWLRELLRETLGEPGAALWLTERIWEPDLAVELVEAGVETVLVDDRHFLVNGFAREALHAPWRTESSGRGLWVLPIDERLRYLIPFRPPAESTSYLRGLRQRGYQLAVLADDGEKFGGWPGTRDWVYGSGWLREFLDALDRLRAEDAVVLSTPARAVRTVPSAGLAYLPTVSYREMEGWALWPDAARRLHALEVEVGERRIEGPDGALIRGTHWRNFLAKYPESNRMHKKMVSLSLAARRAGDPPAVRRAIGRAQCNDAYWHGIFGGLYLPHLRHAVWRELARAEGALRQGQGLAWEWTDLDHDGHDELWIHAAAFAAMVSPRRGGGIEEYTTFSDEVNHADVLTRRLEAYHEVAGSAHAQADAHEGTPSIHEIERGLALAELPPVDAEPRAMFLERVLDHRMTLDALAAGPPASLRSWAGLPLTTNVTAEAGHLRVALHPAGEADTFRKTFVFTSAGLASVEFSWVPPDHDAVFTTEVSHRGLLTFAGSPAADVWEYPVETLAKSERGFERATQGTAVVLRWPASLGAATVQVGAREPA